MDPFRLHGPCPQGKPIEGDIAGDGPAEEEEHFSNRELPIKSYRYHPSKTSESPTIKDMVTALLIL